MSDEPRATYRFDRVESALASAADKANSWAREAGVPECKRMEDVRDVIDALWATLSVQINRATADAAALRSLLIRARRDGLGIHEGDISDCPECQLVRDIVVAVPEAAYENDPALAASPETGAGG